MSEVFHKTDIYNFSETKKAIVGILERTDFLHVQSLNDALGYLSRGQLMCALDAMERQGLVEIRKSKQDIYVSLNTG